MIFFAPKALEDSKREEQFILGGAQLPNLPHAFPTRFTMRGAFEELMQIGALSQEDRQLFMQAMPHWETGLSGMSGHKQGDLLSQILVREIEARKNLSKLLQDRGTLEKANEALEHYGNRVGNFWGAVRGYPETFDQNKDKEDLYRYGLFDRDLLKEIDRVAVEEQIQHASFYPEKDELSGLKLTHRNVGGVVVNMIQHGFTHAAHAPQAIGALNKDSEEEIERVLGKRS